MLAGRKIYRGLAWLALVDLAIASAVLAGSKSLDEAYQEVQIGTGKINNDTIRLCDPGRARRLARGWRPCAGGSNWRAEGKSQLPPRP